MGETLVNPSDVPNPNGQPFDVLVITHNRLDLTMRCMNALYGNTRRPFHLIVVDDSTDVITPIYLDQLKAEHSNVSILHSDVPYKCGNQIFNIALSAMKSNFLGLVMNSVRVEPDWEIVALDIFRANPKVGLIGFKCLLPTGYIESAGIKMIKWLPTDMGRDLSGHRLVNVYEPDAVQWAFAMIRKQAAVGNLDENIFHGFRGWDDIDNCFVLKKAGWRVLYCGAGVGYHEPRATRGDSSPEAMQQNKENGEAFYKRWGFWEEFQKAVPEDTIHKMPAGVNVE